MTDAKIETGRLRAQAIDMRALWLKISANISALTAAQIFYRVVSLALSILLARYLGVREQGLYALVLNFIAMFSAFTDLGISNLVIRDMNQEHDKPAALISSYLWLLAVANLLLFAAAVVTAILFAYESRVTSAIVLAGAGMLVGGISSAFYAALIGRERMKRVAALEVILTLVIVAGMAAVMLTGGGIVELAGVSAAAGIARLLLFGYPALRLFPDIRFRPETARALSMLKRGVPFTLHVGTYVILTRVDVVLLEWLSDGFTLGIYTAAARLTYPMTVLSMMTATAVFPVLSRMVREDRGAAFSMVRSAMRWLSATGAIVAATVAVFAPQIVTLLFGGEYAPAGSVLRILIWYIPILYFYQVVSDLLVAADKVWGIVAVSVACLALNLALNSILIPSYGAHGAAATTIACEAIRCTGLIAYAHAALGFVPAGRTGGS